VAVPTHYDDVIDSRDVIARIAELQAQAIGRNGPRPLTEVMELHALTELADEARHYAEDWGDGAELIRDSYFVDYARDLADEVGLVDRDARWPLNHIDWPAAAEALKADYSEVTFGFVRYWVR
jgi:hypothetical protein